MNARLIPGLLRPSGGPILALCPTSLVGPSVSIDAVSDGVAVGVGVTALRPSSALSDALDARGVFAYRLDVGACAGAMLDVTVSSDGEVLATLRVDVVPDTVPPGGLTFAYASCYYDYGGNAPSYLAALGGRIAFGPPAFKILGGDNVYLDVVPGQFWKNRPFDETVDVYIRYFLESAYGDVLSSTPTVTTWDDHEFWNNYPERQEHLKRSKPPNAATYTDAAQSAIDVFQAPLNPAPVAGGRSYEFVVDPISFFVADVRSSRAVRTSAAAEMLAPTDLRALTLWARGLRAPGVLVLGQPLWIAEGSINDWTPPDFATDYGAIWAALEEAPFDVLVVSGDVHHSRALELEVRNRAVYEIVSSPAAHIPSVIGVAAGSVLGTSLGQDRSKVSFPSDVGVSPDWGVHPKLVRQICAHNAPNSLALIQLRPVGDRVDVGFSLVDHRAGVAPANVLPDGDGPICQFDHAFSLQRRT